MHRLIIFLFCVASVADYAALDLNLPGILKFVPEMLSIIIAVTVMFQGVRNGLSLVPAKYWLVFGFLALSILGGIFTNDVGTGPILAGMRYYLRAIPLFFVPMVAKFDEQQIRTQMKVVLGIALLQVPLSIYQRYMQFALGHYSGDAVQGTLLDSGILSIFMTCVAVVIVALLMRGQMRKLPAIILFFTVLLPTTINETKATVIFVPVGLLAALITAAPRGKRVQVFVGGVTLLALFAAIFLPIYEAMNANSPYKSKGLVDFFTNQQQLSNYMVGKRDVGFGTKHMVSRGAAIKFPLQFLARDPTHLAFGLGIGAASHSALGGQFSGEYADLFSNFVVSAVACFLLEIGLLGLLLVGVFMWMQFTDAVALSRMDNGLWGALAAGFVGIVGVIGLALFYDVTHSFVSVSFLYWYWAGVIVAKRSQLQLEKQRQGAAIDSRARMGAPRSPSPALTLQPATRPVRNT